MKIVRFFIFTAVAVAAFSHMAMAAESVLPAHNPQVKNELKSGLISSATTQVQAGDTGYTDFDALSTINDPLYLEGSKAFLKQIVKGDAAKAGKTAPVLRDALNSRPASLIKKPRVKKSLPADPVKVKNIL